MMRPLKRVGWLLAGLLLAIAVAGAAGVDVQCPEKLDVSETGAATGAWQVYASTSTHAFAHVRLFNGHPQGKVMLTPDDTDEQEENYRWTLGEAGDNLWVDCTYRSSASQLIQQLPKGLRSCEADKAGASISLHCE